MSKPVIRFENVGKLYRLGTVGTGTLSHDLRRWWITNIMRREDPYLKIGETNDRASKGHSDYVYALRDINLEVNEGDVLGIIGKNGAGKSTLLKLLSRVTAPTTGKIYTRGRIASLLEVGTGFHPELTGRENIYMNGCILGMKRHEIDKKLDEIVDFSGCERYIDTPVKRYSSGMMVRLGFAVAAHLDPEILVVDEVLAVGDFEFQTMAIKKMKSISNQEGRTIIFVSHNMENLRILCKSGVLMSNGLIQLKDSIDNTVGEYLSSISTMDLNNHIIISKEMHSKQWSTYEIIFKEIIFQKQSLIYASNENITLYITVESSINVNKCRICSTITDSYGKAICKDAPTDFFAIKNGEKKTVEYTICNPGLVKGKYFLSFSVGEGNIFEGEKNYSVIERIVGFEVDKNELNSDKVYAQWSTDAYGNILLKSSLREINDAK